MKISSVDEMRAMDRHAIGKLGIPEAILMENAGQAAASVLAREIGIPDRKIVIFCGAGNNGGDGFVVARKIHADGGRVKVYLLGNPDKFTGAARMNLEILARLPVEVQPVQSMKKTRMEILHCHGIVDAIFGTGLDREVGGLYREAIALINASGKKVVSLDIPSGVNGDTGQIMGAAVQADYTVTFGLPKIGAMLYPGYERCGKLYVCHISFPSSPFADAARSPAKPWIKTPFLTASSSDRPRPNRAAIVPVSTSPEPAVAIPELPLKLINTCSSGHAIREWAPLRTTQAPRSNAVFCTTAIFCRSISAACFPVILAISPGFR
jgi:hydroxyethylthiazole kinase-like uncharacterized protein yjeF